MWKKNLDRITPYKPGKPIAEVKRELGLDAVIKLASNENPMGPSPRAIEAIRKEAETANRYPDGGCFYLRRALSEKLSVRGDDIVFGNGSDELIVLTLRAFLETRDEVIIASPTFLVYKIASEVEGATIKTVPLKEYKYDLKAMAEAVTENTKIIFIANPDNPTGSYVTASEFEEFMEKIPGDVVVFIDEAYYEYASGKDYPETLSFVEREDRNIIVARTFSKAYALAGLRVGYCVARGDIARALNKVREPFNINSLAQVAAIAALEDREYLSKAVDLVSREKDKIYKAFEVLDVRPFPSRTNFILVNVGRNSSAVFEYLLKRGIIVRDMSAWGIDDCIRVNMGLPEENDMFLKVFTEALMEIPKK